ncbi:11139_t:CDS:2 [Gigaspora margarita]|uniref:11139_t:CDS:1 n=1 Tax=Gigaspora margarita TaxID=4874 RepID=A0ABN7UUF3_GIGMA|nr:11139_t:CDS:2 [Gigaspora margarita]
MSRVAGGALLAPGILQKLYMIKAQMLKNISLTDEDYVKYLNHFKTPTLSLLIEKIRKNISEQTKFKCQSRLVPSEDALVNYQTSNYSSAVNQSSCYQSPAVFLAN